MTEAEQRIGVSLDHELQDQFKALKKYHGISANTEMVRILIREKHRELFHDPSSKISQKILKLTKEDKTFLDVIAQDHWAQFHSFEEEAVAESIITNFRQDPEKPKNLTWLAEAIAYCCSLKGN